MGGSTDSCKAHKLRDFCGCLALTPCWHFCWVAGPHALLSHSTHRLGGLRRWRSALQGSEPRLHLLGGRDGMLGFIS